MHNLLARHFMDGMARRGAPALVGVACMAVMVSKAVAVTPCTSSSAASGGIGDQAGAPAFCSRLDELHAPLEKANRQLVKALAFIPGFIDDVNATSKLLDTYDIHMKVAETCFRTLRRFRTDAIDATCSSPARLTGRKLRATLHVLNGLKKLHQKLQQTPAMPKSDQQARCARLIAAP